MAVARSSIPIRVLLHCRGDTSMRNTTGHAGTLRCRVRNRYDPPLGNCASTVEDIHRRIGVTVPRVTTGPAATLPDRRHGLRVAATRACCAGAFWIDPGNYPTGALRLAGVRAMNRPLTHSIQQLEI